MDIETRTSEDPPPYENPTPEYKARVRALNDLLRISMKQQYGQIMITTSVFALSDADKADLMKRVRAFAAFDKANDPHEEHDFGMVNLADDANTAASYDSEARYSTQYCWKIDYYNNDHTMHSPDPSDPAVTQRVMTIMHISEN